MYLEPHSTVGWEPGNRFGLDFDIHLTVNFQVVCLILPIYLSSPAFNFHCHVIPWPLFKLASSPLGLQVPVLFKLFEPRSYSTSRGSWPCPRLCSVACPRGGHLAFRLASTVRRFGAWTSPISTVILTSRQVGGNPRMVGAPPDSLTIALITVSAGWVRDCRARPGN